MATHDDKQFWEKVCRFCNKMFPSKKHLDWHQRGHTESGDFQCELCDLILKKKSCLTRHLKEVRGRETPGNYEEIESTDSDIS